METEKKSMEKEIYRTLLRWTREYVNHGAGKRVIRGTTYMCRSVSNLYEKGMYIKPSELRDVLTATLLYEVVRVKRNYYICIKGEYADLGLEILKELV